MVLALGSRNQGPILLLRPGGAVLAVSTVGGGERKLKYKDALMYQEMGGGGCHFKLTEKDVP